MFEEAMPAAGYIRFPLTQWSLLETASDGQGEARREAVSQVVRLYSSAIRAFVASRRGVRADHVDDIVQDFLTFKWIERDFFATLDRQRGRFRAYLLVSLRNFVARWLRRDRAGSMVAYSESAASARSRRGCSSDRSFWQEWARQILLETVERFRAQCMQDQRPDLWGIFEARVIRPTLLQGQPTPYEQLVEAYGFKSPVQAGNALVTAKRAFVRVLHQVLLQYEDGERHVDQQVNELMAILGAGQ